MELDIKNQIKLDIDKYLGESDSEERDGSEEDKLKIKEVNHEKVF